MSASSKKKTTHPEAYTSLLELYQQANPLKKKEAAIQEAQQLWNELKGDKNRLEEKLKLLKLEGEQKKTEARLFFLKATLQNKRVMSNPVEEQVQDVSEDSEEDSEDTFEETHNFATREWKTPVQFNLKEKIVQLNQELQQLRALEDNGMITDEDKDRKRKIQAEISTSSKALLKLEKQQQTQQKYRDRKKQKLQGIETQLKESGIDIQLTRPTIGRPRLEETQPGLLEAILHLVSMEGQADERRQSEIIRSVKTLDRLQEALSKMNYKLSRSATYLRLVPKRFNTEEGKRHVKTVPVKLLRSRNTARRSHEDTRFCAALVRNIKEMVSILGPQSVLVISQDDKARIPLGLAAASKQAPILMRLEYRVELPDHDWVVAEKHKLIPSVYAILNVQNGKYGHAEAVTYSGPTFIRIRSGKHDSSTAYSHGKDFDTLMIEEQLYSYTRTAGGQSKPIVVLLTDGGPDENPRYKKTIQMMIEHFIKYDLDTIITACFAPHQSASNPVERRMAPLSHDLAGIILPHDTFGSHLDKQLKTTDENLEKRNFKAAAEALASVWENTIIDGYPVLAKYVDPPEEHYRPEQNKESVAWIEKHTITCHYFTQVVKCDDSNCCKPFRSGIRQLLQNRFFSPLIMIQQKPHKICAASINAIDDTTHFSNFLLSVVMEGKILPPEMDLQHFPFDWYCPTVNRSIDEYLCIHCHRYFGLKGSLKHHVRKCSHRSSRSSVESAADTQDSQDADYLMDSTSNVTTIHNYRDGEFLVSDESGEAMWVEKRIIPEDLSEPFLQQVQVQADRALVVDWAIWKHEWTNDE